MIYRNTYIDAYKYIHRQTAKERARMRERIYSQSIEDSLVENRLAPFVLYAKQNKTKQSKTKQNGTPDERNDIPEKLICLGGWSFFESPSHLG